MLTRRKFLLDGILAVSIVATPCCLRAASGGPRGCLISSQLAYEYLGGSSESQHLFVSGNEPIISKSGNADFDRALARNLARTSDVFGVLPGFAFYNDDAGPNAFATGEVRMERADGTVLFGQTLLSMLLGRAENPDACVAAVCAHEFAHILQYKHGLTRQRGLGDQPTVKRIELQADFLAGYYAGRRKLERNSYPAAVFALTQSGFGDAAIHDRNHHGTPEQRGEAISMGFASAYRRKQSLSDAIQESTNYVLTQ